MNDGKKTRRKKTPFSNRPIYPTFRTALTYGIGVAEKANEQSLLDFHAQVVRQFMQNEQKGKGKKLLCKVSRHTTPIYGDLRARLFEKFAPKKRRRKGLRPEELIDPITSRTLGIQENDLWIAAQAIEHNYVLVTNDAMIRIQEVAPELRVEDWAVENT